MAVIVADVGGSAVLLKDDLLIRGHLTQVPPPLCRSCNRPRDQFTAMKFILAGSRRHCINLHDISEVSSHQTQRRFRDLQKISTPYPLQVGPNMMPALKVCLPPVHRYTWPTRLPRLSFLPGSSRYKSVFTAPASTVPLSLNSSKQIWRIKGWMVEGWR